MKTPEPPCTEIILSKGNDYCLEFLHAEEVDRKTISHRVSIPVFSPTGEYVGEKEDIQEETLILYRTKFSVPEAINPLTRKNHAKLAWIQFVCPSTGTNYLISTSPSFDNMIEHR
ncbi:MAG: hypothetical protein RML35_12080 [Chloroherpetonaceae bacterium]|nr:hypothetical protein [Chloroherpetonaceae bacterium]